MQDYPSYTRLNSYDLKHLSNSDLSFWLLQHPRLLNDFETTTDRDTQPGSLIDCFVTVGLMIFMLASSSLLLGFAADRLTQGILALVEHQSTTELVAR